MKRSKKSIPKLLFAAAFLAANSNAEEKIGKAETLMEVLTKAEIRGKVRTNTFMFKWGEENEKRKDHTITGFGGNLQLETAELLGFSAFAGWHGTFGAGSLEDSEANLYKGGKDVIERHDILNNGRGIISVFSEAYLKYRKGETTLKAGRQAFSSFLTKTNDTKMIPNTFEGVSLENTSIPSTSIKTAILTKQKLRDHSDFHHVLAVGDNPSDPYSKYTENDDSAMHFGLKLSELESRGIEDRLIIIEAKNKSMENLTVNLNYTTVPKLVSSMMAQADYKLDLLDWTVTPGIRYMKQFDEGAGEIGGANLKTNTHGYANPLSLDGEMYGARVDLKKDRLKLRLGYTVISDDGDLLAPWRGFPTGGFTRAMGQYNWQANTKSFMAQADYKFKSIKNLSVSSRFAIQDFDDEKAGVQSDSKAFTLDFRKKMDSLPVYIKTRLAHVIGEEDTIVQTIDGTITKPDSSYDEFRIEFNYLF